MTQIPSSHLDLLQSSVATFATIGPDGRPQLSEVWFLSEGDTVAVSMNTSRQKLKNLRERPQCCLFILDLANPMRYLELRGDAEITPDSDYSFAEKVGKKYGADLRAYDGPDDQRVVVRLVPHKVNAIDMGG
ncbi:MAG: PPOX class F420-dependent oxidoreductase [Acidimicrobiales bacterium]